MKKFLCRVPLVCLLFSACTTTVVTNALPPAMSAEGRAHAVAAEVGSFTKARWGYPGLHLDSVEHMLSAYLGTSVWCFQEVKRGVRVARCTSKRHLDTVLASEDTMFSYQYFPSALRYKISIPIFLDTCYLCGRYQSYRYYRHHH